MPQALKPLPPYQDADTFIGARVRAHRLACGLSQADVAGSALLSRSLHEQRRHLRTYSRDIPVLAATYHQVGNNTGVISPLEVAALGTADAGSCTTNTGYDADNSVMKSLGAYLTGDPATGRADYSGHEKLEGKTTCTSGG